MKKDINRTSTLPRWLQIIMGVSFLPVCLFMIMMSIMIPIGVLAEIPTDTDAILIYIVGVVIGLAALLVSIWVTVLTVRLILDKQKMTEEQRIFNEELRQYNKFHEEFKTIEPLAKQGDAKSEYRLSVMYSIGMGVKKSNRKAFKWLLKAGEHDHPEAFYELYLAYTRSITRRDRTEALRWLHKAGEHGDYDALKELVDIYRKGKGVKEDDAEALKWLRKAAEEGLDFGLKELGLMYYEGNGVPQDHAEAAKLFHRAFDHNCRGSTEMLGKMYFEGLGVRQDYDKAAKYFSWEANWGNSECEEKLIDMYKKGMLRDPDSFSTIELFRKAEAGDPDLQLRFGMRKWTFRDFRELFFNKLGFFSVGGVVTMLLLVWYDWVMFADLSTRFDSSWWLLCVSGVFGFAFSDEIAGDIEYQVESKSRASGIPFPVVLWEPAGEDSDHWIDFVGTLTYVSWFLNSCYWILCFWAIALTIVSYLV
jgi:TPR repeat protein